jgi:VCBS repeat-containing protein
VGPVEYQMRAAVGGGWALSTDGTADAQNELVVKALFNSTSGGSYGAGTTDLLITTDKSVGDAGGEFEGDVDMDNLALNQTENLFVRFTLPPTSSVGTQQTVTVTVTGEAAN